MQASTNVVFMFHEILRGSMNYTGFPYFCPLQPGAQPGGQLDILVLLPLIVGSRYIGWTCSCLCFEMFKLVPWYAACIYVIKIGHTANLNCRFSKCYEAKRLLPDKIFSIVHVCALCSTLWYFSRHLVIRFCFLCSLSLVANPMLFWPSD